MTEPLLEVSRDWTPISAKGCADIPAVSYREGKRTRGACRVVTSVQRHPSKPTVATTIHTNAHHGAVWAEAVKEHSRGCPRECRSDAIPVVHAKSGKPIMLGSGDDAIQLTRNVVSEYHVPKAPGPNYRDVFALYAKCLQPANVSPRRERVTPAEREQLRCALEGAPYVIKVGDRVTGMFAKREQAAYVASRMGSRATLYHVGARYAWVEGATMVLPRSDRAQGPSSVLAGQGSKTVRHRVVVGYDEQRIELVAAHRLKYDATTDTVSPHNGDMNGRELKREHFVSEEQWTRNTPRPDGHFDRTLGRWVFAA